MRVLILNSIGHSFWMLDQPCWSYMGSFTAHPICAVSPRAGQLLPEQGLVWQLIACRESWHTGVKIMTLCKHRLVSPGRRSREPRSCWKLSPPLHPETTNGCQPYWQEVWDEKYEQRAWGEEKYKQRAWKKKWHLEQIAALLQVHRQCWEAALTSTNNRWQNW